MGGLTRTTFPAWAGSNPSSLPVISISFAWRHKQPIYFFRPQLVGVVPLFSHMQIVGFLMRRLMLDVHDLRIMPTTVLNKNSRFSWKVILNSR